VDVTDGTSVGIGELSRRTGVPVRTIRFYCDEGVIETRRSAGGHRRFDVTTVERLTLVRRLRALGLGLPAITDVLTGSRGLDEAVAAERAALDVELASLAWRRAALRAVEQADPAQRSARLALLAVARDGPAAHNELVTFWRHLFAAPVGPEVFHTFVAMSVPDPPADPTPEQVVAYAELVTLSAAMTGPFLARAIVNRAVISGETALLTGIGAACEQVVPLVADGLGPTPGAELDHFVDAHASARGRRDTPEFRRDLLTYTAPDRDRRMLRYWTLVGTVTGDPTTSGTWHTWLLDALAVSVLAE
jgi:DNA-binding transcriptional MerR regulator